MPPVGRLQGKCLSRRTGRCLLRWSARSPRSRTAPRFLPASCLLQARRMPFCSQSSSSSACVGDGAASAVTSRRAWNGRVGSSRIPWLSSNRPGTSSPTTRTTSAGRSSSPGQSPRVDSTVTPWMADSFRKAAFLKSLRCFTFQFLSEDEPRGLPEPHDGTHAARGSTEHGGIASRGIAHVFVRQKHLPYPRGSGNVRGRFLSPAYGDDALHSARRAVRLGEGDLLPRLPDGQCRLPRHPRLPATRLP